MELYLDCSYGISGDMALAALVDLGLELEPFQAALARAGTDCILSTWTEQRAAGPGRRVDVQWPADQPLRHPADLAAIIGRLDMSETARNRALAAVEALTLAEAHAHGIAPQAVHFHEVGAIDTLVDLAGTCWGLEQLGIERVTASPLPWFSGTVVCAHGEIPLPAPATAWLLRGKPVYPVAAREELITPTGAALLHVLAEDFVPGPTGIVQGLGTGYGSRPQPGGLRAWLLRPAARQVAHELGGHEQVLQLECHLDHLTGEELGAALSALAEEPDVLDVLWLPGLGKKNRPSGLLRVLCRPQACQRVTTAVLRHTHTLGLRQQYIDRVVLPRRAAVVNCAGQPLPAKAYALDGQHFVRAEAAALQHCAAEQGLGMPGLRFKEQS